MKTSKIIQVANLLENAKFSELEDEQAFTLVASYQKIKKVKEDFEDFKKTALEKLKDDKFESNQKEYQAILTKSEGKKIKDLSEEDQTKFFKLSEYFRAYEEKLAECIKPEEDKETTLELTKVDKKSLFKLSKANGWSLDQTLLISEVVAEGCLIKDS